MFERICPKCEDAFLSANPHRRYCSERCKKRAQFARWYAKAKNKRSVRARMKRYQRQRRAVRNA